MSGARLSVDEITRPDDARLIELSALMNATFADPNTVLGLDRLREFLAANGSHVRRRFCVVVLTDAERAGAVVAGCVFSYVVASNCGFSEYMLADPRERGRGVGRQLFDVRKTLLDAEARRHGNPACRGVFIEVDDPLRAAPELLAVERQTAMDGWQRLRLFSHLGFLRVDIPYVQPALAGGKQPVDYLALLFAPWDASAATSRLVPSEWVFDTLAPIWSAWSPGTCEAHLNALREQVASKNITLSYVL